ncbi:protein NYNRIN-like [Monomorium pharaonis]|uniref:protein NYNRIN-like n=1 Tax=Monomorium pharaonis TaxID=307658 RepID=UPI0017463101|nr:protein NYNRIN-like [Monomorium pharaonis]
MSFRNLEEQLARWMERLQQYDFDVLYRRERFTIMPTDFLDVHVCRIYAAQLQDAVVSKIVHFKEAGTRPDWQEIAFDDPSLKIYWSYWDTLLLIDGVLHKKWISPNLQKNVFQIVVPRQRIHEILKEAHDSPSGGHFGPLGKGKSPMEIYNVGAPFERIQVDILGPLPTSSSENKYLLVVVDCFSKWPEAVPLKNKRANTVARSLVDQVFSRHGIPLELHTDQGRNFECHLFKEMTLLLGIRKSRTVLAYRSSKQEAIGMSPVEMYLGQDLRLPLDLLRGVSPSTEEEKDSAGFVSKLR